jgi:hypothetical protein
MEQITRRVGRAMKRLGAVTVLFSLFTTGVVAPGPDRPRVQLRALRLLAAREAAPPGWTKTVVPEISTQLVALEWDGQRAGAVDVRVRVADRWLAWRTLEGTPDEGPDPDSLEHRGTTTTAPAWTGTGVERIQLRVDHGDLRGLKLHLIHSEEDKAAVATASATPGNPGIVSRAQWGANESIRNTAPDCTSDPRYASTVRNGFVHHTVNVNNYSADQSDDLIRGIYQFHVQTNRWCDIGYNFLVDRFGKVFEGRYGGIDRAVIGAHAGGFNTGSTGVALLGDFRTTAPSDWAMYALRHLLAWKFAMHGVDPRSQTTVVSAGSTRYAAGTSVTLQNIAGHSDVSLTECPGEQLYPRLAQLRVDVQSAILSTPPFPLNWTPNGSEPRILAINGLAGLQPAGGQGALPHSAYFPGWDITRGAASTGGGGYTLDGWGGLHPFGSAPSPVGFAYWRYWDIARGVTMIGPGSGYTLDGFGGVHPFGGAPPLPYSGYWRNWDIARGITARTDGLGGYVLDGFGGIHPFGVAASVKPTGYWNGWDIARAIALRSDGRSGYVLDGFGGIHPFGGAPAVTGHYAGRDEMRAIVLNEAGTGGWTMDASGFVWPFGSAQAVKQSATWTGAGIGRALVRLTL